MDVLVICNIRNNFKVKYSLPFKGEWLVVNGGIEKKFSHSWSIHSQRYAYDFFKINENMKSHINDPENLDNYYCYDNEINSPADGKVVKVVDKFKDSIIMDNNQSDPLAKNIPGNYIVIKHVDKEYSFLAHLKPHSVVVKEGEYIKRHQKIGHCGNTGNTTESHLHFQIQTGVSFIFSAGIPICFNDINIESIPNYHLLDSRETKMPNNDSKENVQFINRGYMVENE